MKIYIVRIIGVVAVLVWLLVASYPQIVLAQTCTNSDNRPVPCPPSSGGGKRHKNTAQAPVVIQATAIPTPLPTATVSVLAVIPGTGGNIPEPALPPTQTPPVPPDPFLVVLGGIIAVLIIIGSLFGAGKFFRKAGGVADGSDKMGGQPHMDDVPSITTYPANELDVFPRSQDEDYFDGQIFGGKLPSPDALATSLADGSVGNPDFHDGSDKMGGQPHMDGSVKNHAFEIEDYSFTVDNPTTIGSATGGAGGGKIFRKAGGFADGSDKMGGQPHMGDGSVGNPDFHDGSDKMGGQPHMDLSDGMTAPGPPDAPAGLNGGGSS